MPEAISKYKTWTPWCLKETELNWDVLIPLFLCSAAIFLSLDDHSDCREKKLQRCCTESEFQTAERDNLPGSDYSVSPPSLEICPLLTWLLLLPPGTSQQTERVSERCERVVMISGNTSSCIICSVAHLQMFWEIIEIIGSVVIVRI